MPWSSSNMPGFNAGDMWLQPHHEALYAFITTPIVVFSIGHCCVSLVPSSF